MGNFYFAGAFSINMIEDFPSTVKIERMKETSGNIIKVIKKMINENRMTSYMGHQTTADILGLPFNRGNLKVKTGDKIYLAQYIGPRLEEGTKVLPPEAKIDWFVVSIS